MKRIFAAVKINPQPALIKYSEELKLHLSDSNIKWVEIHNLHLTIKFFGETNDEKVIEIEEALKNIQAAPFDFEIGNLKIFGSRYDPRVIFLEALHAEPFLALSSLVNEQISPLGYEPDRQNFIPHLTLGRVKKIADKKYFQKIISDFSGKIIQSQHVGEFHLIESILRNTGPEYKILQSYKFF